MNINNILFAHKKGNGHSMPNDLCVSHDPVSVARDQRDVLRKSNRILSTSGEGSNKHSITDELRALQDWVFNTSHDVLNESDEILHLKYQLVYPIGNQIPIDDHPNRWVTIQQVFTRLQVHAVALCTSFLRMLDIDTTPWGFPIVHILDSAIFQQISLLIIDNTLEGRLSNLPVGILPSSIRGAAHRFMSQAEVSDMDHTLIQPRCVGTISFNAILVLCGLLMDGGGVLAYVLKEQ